MLAALLCNPAPSGDWDVVRRKKKQRRKEEREEPQALEPVVAPTDHEGPLRAFIASQPIQEQGTQHAHQEPPRKDWRRLWLLLLD